MIMIIGQYSSKLTDKNRVSVPKKFREELGEQLIIAKWYEYCLVVVSKDKWMDVLKRLTGMESFITEPVRDIDRFILGSAYEVQLDSQGRFIVPDLLLSHANIQSEATFVGLGDRIEIWSSEAWVTLEHDSQSKAAEALETLSKASKQ